MTMEGTSGSIYDLGYRGYEGPRLGRRAAVISLLVHSLRTAYGLGRGARSKAMPMSLVAMAVLPSLLGLGIIALVNQLEGPAQAFEAISPIKYATLFPFISTLVFLFCASQAPELFGRDQRAGVLPLYFSRAITRVDYAMARALGLFAAVLVLVLAPQLLLLVGRILVAKDLLDGLVEELPQLPAMLLVGVLVTLVVGSISAAIAALTPRRSYATVAIIGIFLIPNIAASMLVWLDAGLLGQVAVLLSPADVLDGVNANVFDSGLDNLAASAANLSGTTYLLAACGWIAVSLAILVRRYQKIVA
jgi:ABC-2 type transport system permease protein